MTFQVAAVAAEMMALRFSEIKRKTCAAARDAASIDPDEMFAYFKNRFLGLGFDLDGPDLSLESEIPIDDRPRGPARPGFRWARGPDGKWHQVQINTSGGG